MKDNISIIFTAIIGVLLIVILPLFSILDRQDSMSYNVVLTQTTNFVDNIRNNGFIDKDAYYNYITSLASTANTYKVELEVYKKRLIPDEDLGQDVYVEELELFNTKDVLEVLENSNNIAQAESSNIKNNVYLLNQNDEVYVKVYNTNITAGSVLYGALASDKNNKVIDISYGGVVNNVNWELFKQIDANVINIPEVSMEVPVNANNKTNIKKVTQSGDLADIDCNLFEYLCEDGPRGDENNQYTYLYDLTYTENKQMNIAVELKNIESIVAGIDEEGNLKFTDLKTLTKSEFNSIKSYIIENYIVLNEMFADVDLEYRGKGEYYMFNIVLNNIEIMSSELMSVMASVSILPGLGQDADGDLSIGAETVLVELKDESSIHSVSITGPLNWKKLLKTKSASESLMDEVYVNLDIAFVISYTGINDAESVKNAVQEKLSIKSALYKDLEVITATKLKTDYDISLNTRTVGHVIVKFKYIAENTSMDNYIKLDAGWINLDVNDENAYIDEDYVENSVLAYGAESKKYQIWVDNSAPVLPTILVDGIEGDNGWYIGESVKISLKESVGDTIIKEGKTIIGGSGIDMHTLAFINTPTQNNSIIEKLTTNIEKEGIYSLYATVTDYSLNLSQATLMTVKLDNTNPTAPQFRIQGTAGKNNWYISNVTLSIIPGSDALSGYAYTTYSIEGVQTQKETKIPQSKNIVLTENGKHIVYITTYDKAGNYATTKVQINIDKTTPAGGEFLVISGAKNARGWYNTDVQVKIKLKENVSPSIMNQAYYSLESESGNNSTEQISFSGNEKIINITNSDRYVLKLLTSNAAGSVNLQEYKINIDKDAPNTPSISVTSDKEISNGWYTDDVQVTLEPKGDIGPSQERSFSYIYTKDGVSTGRYETKPKTVFSLIDEGIHEFDVFSLDYADNQSQAHKEIKIDKTDPESAQFVISGTRGLKGWYVSDVEISYKGGSDAVSGIKSIKLSKTSLTKDTTGTTVTMTTEDNAGHKVEIQTTIKLDKTIPIAPKIEIPQVTGTGITGVNLYNKEVPITIYEGRDSNKEKTTVKVVDMESGKNLIAESELNSLTLKDNGRYEVTSYTYDYAGNKGISSKIIWINKDKPQRPSITAINGQTVQDNTLQTVIGNTNTLNIQFKDVEIGSRLKVTLIKEDTYEVKEVEVQASNIDEIVSIELPEKGKYRITATQTNMYGTESDVNIGSYNYQYE